MPRPTYQLTLRVDPDVYAQLVALAERTGETRTGVVARLLTEGLARAKRTAKPTGDLSMFEAMSGGTVPQ